MSSSSSSMAAGATEDDEDEDEDEDVKAAAAAAEEDEEDEDATWGRAATGTANDVSPLRMLSTASSNAPSHASKAINARSASNDMSTMSAT
jgi:hypothetical protein